MGKRRRQRRNSGDHRGFIDELELLVKDQYQMVLKEIEYGDPYSDKTIGELDLLGIVGGRWDIYEVKCNDGYEKAVDQLYRAKNYFGDDVSEIRLFYYSGLEKEIVEVCR